jgi:hypothetical protein
MFCGVSLSVLQSHFINTVGLTFVISLLKQISSEDIGSKSWLILIALISVSCVCRLWL